MRIKVTKEDNFVWLVVNDKAKEIFNSGLFSLYELFEDDSEMLILTPEHLNKALESGNDIGIEGGHIPQTT